MPTLARYDRILRVGCSEAQRAWLNEHAERRGLSASAVVREMLQAAMRAERNEAQNDKDAA